MKQVLSVMKCIFLLILAMVCITGSSEAFCRMEDIL